MADDRKRQQAWRTGSTRPAFVEPGRKPKGAGKRFAVIALILAVVGVIGGLFYFWRSPPEPIFLGLAVTQYADRGLPPNAWAQQDSEALRQQFTSDSSQAFQGQERRGLLDALTQIAERTGQSKDKGRPVVVHLSAHATARDGKVYLLPGEANPSNRGSWLALEDVLAALRRGSGPRLLLLDLARPIADAHAGLLTDDVADALDAELTLTEQAGNLPFLVLTACGKGEVAHASPELQRSTFGFFLEQALLGHADGWKGEKSKDGQVSALELAEYVRVQVAKWAAQQRVSPQNPTLYGTSKGKDFVLISPKRPFAPVTLPGPPLNYPDWLLKGWQERDAWRDTGLFRQVPRTYRELEATLLHSEQRWQSGDDEPTIKFEFEGKLADLKAQRAELTLKEFPPRSIAQARRAGAKDEKAVGTAIRSLLEAIQSKVALKPEDLRKPAEKPPEAAPFAMIAHHVLAAALEVADPTSEQLKEFAAVLSALSPPPRFAELAALRFLIDLDPKVVERWNDKGLVGVRRLVLYAARASEEAVAIDPRALPWLKADLAAADIMYSDAILQLASGNMEARIDGRRKLIQVGERYDTITRTAQVIERGFQRLDEARVTLPALAAPLGRHPPSANDEQLWSALVANTAKLQMHLTPPRTAGRAPLDEINSLGDQLQSDLARVRQWYSAEEAEKQIRRAGKENGPSADALRGLLASPLWPAASRQHLCNAARDLGQTAAAAGINQAVSLTPGTTPPAASSRRADDPAWRARLAIDLLRLDGISDVKPLDDLLAKAAKDPKPESWQLLGEALRKTWAVTLPEKFREPTDAGAREQAGCVVHPADLSALPEGPGRPPQEPTPESRRQQRRDFWQWLARERYRKTGEAFMSVRDRPDLAAYGKALDELGVDLQTRAP